MVLAAHEMARTELERRALNAWSTCHRILNADDADPSEETRAQVADLIQRAVRDFADDIDREYAKCTTRVKTTLPTLDEARQHAAELATSELDIDLLSRRHRRLPLGDTLRAPRYTSVQTHWNSARQYAEDEHDIVAGLREGILAIEALAKTILSNQCATLGECIKLLRAKKLIDAGTGKILEGLWVYANSTPGVRHGANLVTDLEAQDWAVLRPVLESALTLLLLIDV
ncbi:MAG: hypothetical protein WD851_19440 [Pirellulales bacterium]